ncbi:MAG: molybdenum cofactor biosynthesis protein [Lentisphaerae bacterium]|nr:molybdenum cofactor biosynthesis protein [Lentisphaerota bacterium]
MTRLGKVEALCLSQKKGERKTPVTSATFLENHGIDGDAHAGHWHRQVSLLAAEDIDTLRDKGLPDLKPGDFAENMVVSGVELGRLGLGSRLKAGSDVEMAITQLGKVCHNRCAIYFQTGDCVMPRKGLFARVIKGGKVCPGDEVSVLDTVSPDVLQCVVLTISDRCSRGETEDTAGPAVAARLRDGLGGHVYALEVLPDEQQQIEERLKHYCDGHSIDFVCAVGGTGFAPRDVTPEAIAAISDRATPGLDEAMRAASLQKTAHAMLSRAMSGIRSNTLVISLPGSERASVENLDAILPALGHGLMKLRGDPADCGRPPGDPE